MDMEEIFKNRLYMPDKAAAVEAESYLEDMMQRRDSCGGVVECVIRGLPAGVGEPVFDKLDAALGKAVMSIGAVKGFEIGDGFEAAASLGSRNNDSFVIGKDKKPQKVDQTIPAVPYGGMSDGSNDSDAGGTLNRLLLFPRYKRQ